jgi:hypothetical protein
MSETSTGSGGMTFCSLLTVLFIGLKLTGYISWSWIWVLAPLWIPFVIVLLLAVMGLILYTFIKK